MSLYRFGAHYLEDTAPGDVTVTGDLILPSMVSAGNVTVLVDLTGALSLPAIVAAGDVSTPINVTGSLSLPTMTAGGNVAVQVNVGPGDLILPSMALSGDVATDNVATVTGALVLPAMTGTGNVIVPVNVSGSLLLGALSAVGTVSTPVNVSGSLTLPALVAIGDVEVDLLVTGQLILPALVLSGTITTFNPRDVILLRFDEWQREVRFNEYQRFVEFSEWQREIAVGGEMELNVHSREFYDPRPVTSPAIAASSWFASFDDGTTWIAATVIDNLPKWLVAGSRTSLGAAVAQIVETTYPVLRATDNPENPAVAGPRIVLVE